MKTGLNLIVGGMSIDPFFMSGWTVKFQGKVVQVRLRMAGHLRHDTKIIREAVAPGV